MRQARTRIVWAAVVLLTAVAVPSPARAQPSAVQTALERLDPARDARTVEVYAVRVAAGRRIAEFPGPPARRTRGVKLRRPAYLVWEDLAPGALFAHPSELLVVDAVSGATIVRKRLSWWPVIDGRRPAFRARHRVFPAAPKRKASPRQAASSSFTVGGDNGPFAMTKAQMQHECLVMLGGYRAPNGGIGDGPSTLDPDFKGSVDGMRQWATEVGVRTQPPPGTPGAPTNPAKTLDEAAQLVDSFRKQGCKDVFLYVFGHGAEPDTVKGGVDKDGNVKKVAGKGAVPSIAIDVRGERKADGTIENKSTLVTPFELHSFIAASPQLGFKVKLDGCYSGRFVAPLSDLANLHVLEASSAADEMSYGQIKEAVVRKDGKLVKYGGDIPNPFRATEFTNANLHGLYAWARNPQLVADSTVNGVIDLARGIGNAFLLGEDFDAARTLGLTHPSVRTNYTPQPPAAPLMPAPMSSPAPAPPQEKPPEQQPPPKPKTYKCVGSEMLLFDNWNAFTVENNGTSPQFSTHGITYCLVSISTYHYNDGNGAAPGTIGVSSGQGVLGPWPATGTEASGAPNADWTATPPQDPPVIIDGIYYCDDSQPSTWSHNLDSSGGFCRVRVRAAEEA